MRSLVLLSLAVCCLLGCSDNPVDPDYPVNQDPVDETAVVKDGVVVMDDQPLQFVAVVDSTYTYRMTGGINPVKIGDVICAGSKEKTGSGASYMQEVTGVREDGNILTIETNSAAVVDAIESCSSTVRFPLSLPEPDLGDYLAPGVQQTANGFTFDEFVIWQGPIWTPESGTVALVIVMRDGFVTITDRNLDFEMIIVDSEFTRFGSVSEARIDLGYDLDVNVSAEFHHSIEPVELYRQTQIYRHFLGPVPVVHEITTTLEFRFEIDAGAGLDVSFDDIRGTVNAGMGAQFVSGSWQDIGTAALQQDVPVPTVSTHADLNLKPYLVLKIVDMVYGKAGFNVRAEPYLKVASSVEASTDTTSWCFGAFLGCDVGVGAASKLGLFSDVLDGSWESKDLNVFEVTIIDSCWAL